jgi:hypothetical protein
MFRVSKSGLVVQLRGPQRQVSDPHYHDPKDG